MLLCTSCQKGEVADRLGKSGELEEENEIEEDQPLTDRYFIRESIVTVNEGNGTAVKLFYVYLDEDLSEQGIANCLEGMKRFNDLDLMFHLERTDNPKQAHIKALLKEPHEIDNFYAKTFYPKRGMPGSLIRLNRSLYGGEAGTIPDNMETVFAHELGHAFGFVHLDYEDNKFSCNNLAYDEKHSVPIKPVFGTGASRNITNSFMLACMNRNDKRPLLLLDKIGIYNVYGRYRNEGMPFLRYEGKNGYSNYYTSDYNELKEGNDNYESKGIIGRVFLENTKDDSRTPLAYYYNSKAKDHYYTNVLSELGMGNDDYEFIRLYYLYRNTDGKSRLPFIRFVHAKTKKHFYTSDASEAVEMQKSKYWKYDGVIGYLSAN